MPKNKNGKLLIAEPVYKRFAWECEYLALNGRLYVPVEGEQVQSSADLLRWAVSLFVDWAEFDYASFIPFDRQETISYSFWLGDMGKWDYAIKRHFASSYHDLATQALYWYFDRIDSQLERNRATYRQLQQMSVDELVQLFRSGGHFDVLQTP